MNFAMYRLFTCLLLVLLAASLHAQDKFRLGIIGTTTSHVPAFVKEIHAPNAGVPFDKFQVVAAYPGGMPDNPASWGRVEQFAGDLEKQGIKCYSTIEAMLPEVDGILLTSVDGRPHLEQAKPVIAAGKPLFIDKPMAESLADTLEIFRLAKEKNVPVFSASSLRYGKGFQKMRHEQPLGKILGATAWSPCSLNDKHPDLFWYGVHGVEILFTLMGSGCQTVSRTQTPGAELVVGVWNEGRIGTFRGIRTGKAGYGAVVFGEKDNGDAGGYDGYKPLVEEICKFFETGKPPFDPQETIEIFAFMEAADESKRLGGIPVSIAETIAKAKAETAIPVSVVVSPNGAIKMNGGAIELGKLAETLDALATGKPNARVKVILRAEKGTPHEIVLSVCKNLGKALLANFLYER
jgi:biopolymer transport protein ExbD